MSSEMISIAEYNKLMRIKKYTIFVDIFCIIMFISLFFYVFSEIKLVKLAGSDACVLCKIKTGAICIKHTGAGAFNEEVNLSNSLANYLNGI